MPTGSIQQPAGWASSGLLYQEQTAERSCQWMVNRCYIQTAKPAVKHVWPVQNGQCLMTREVPHATSNGWGIGLVEQKPARPLQVNPYINELLLREARREVMKVQQNISSPVIQSKGPARAVEDHSASRKKRNSWTVVNRKQKKERQGCMPNNLPAAGQDWNPASIC